MKKLMMAAAFCVAAVAVEAATFSWTADTKQLGVVTTGLIQNDTYGATGNQLKGDVSNLNVTMYLYALGTDTLVGKSAGQAVQWSTSGAKMKATAIDVTAVEGQSIVGGTEYDYVLVITGVQTSLKNKADYTDGDTIYKYSAATIEGSLAGQVEAPVNGTQPFTTTDVTSWTVKGVTTEVVPEPTSGLLLLLGVAGLALRRRRA